MSEFIDDEDELESTELDRSPNQTDLVFSAVLPKERLVDSAINDAIEAMFSIIHPNDNADGTSCVEKPALASVTRSHAPLNEWDGNDAILRGVFPHLFMLGKGVPQGSISKSFMRHLLAYYDGRFEDPLFIATAFNQKQRHACIRQAARLNVK
ncbi:hypothetical protein AC1031_006691 [Aphanomyces cochlioides]|nr:hypothetical protein AC1031_006691 [Aphanomyces cochlioides]